MTYHVYIMASASHALYTGVTNDIERRVLEHREARMRSFSARYKTRNLVYMEDFGDIRAAIAREKQIKGWLRSKKLALINSANPQWRDLSAEWPKHKAVILSGAKNPSEDCVIERASTNISSEAFATKKAVVKNPSEAFVTKKPVAKNPSEVLTHEKPQANRPTNQNPRRGSSSQNWNSE